MSSKSTGAGTPASRGTQQPGRGVPQETTGTTPGYRPPEVAFLGSLTELVQGTYSNAPYRDRYFNYYKVIG